MSSYKLTYFDIQGAAEKVRLAFVLNGVPFEDHRVTYDQWNGELKPLAKFGQLPLLSIDDGEPIAQSDAMLRYVARLGNASVNRTDPVEELRMNEIIGFSNDIDRDYAPCIYLSLRPTVYGLPEDYGKTDEGKEHIRRLRVKYATETLPIALRRLADLLENAGGQFFGGVTPSLADCQILPQLCKFQAGFIDHIPATVLDNHPSIIQWIARMKAVPEVAEWYTPK